MVNDIIFLLLTFVVSVFTATFGFGSAIILIPFSSFLLPIKKAIAILTLYFIAGGSIISIIFRKNIDWKTTFLLWIGAVPLVFVGALLMVHAPSETIKKILGVVILLYILNEYFQITSKLKLNKCVVISAGGGYGFFSGIIGDGSAVKAAFLTHIGLRKEEFIATMAISSILINIIKSVIYSKFELISPVDIPLLIGLVVCALIGSYIGKNLVKKINPEMFKKIVLIILLLVSLKLLFF